MINLIDRITAEHLADFETQRAHMQTPEFLACAALLQKVADALTADGFEVWPQACWSGLPPDRYPPSVHLHIEINEAHKSAGLRRLYELLPDLVPGESKYTAGAAAIELHPHAGRQLGGWKPAELREAA